MRARSEAQKITKAASIREQAVHLREEEISTREVNVEKEKTRFVTWEKDLQGKEKKLRINQEIFSRAQEFIKKQNKL